MQEPHAFHALFALHKVVRVAYIHSQQSDGTSGASSSTRSLLLPERDRLANDTPPPSRWSAKMTLTGPPPPVSVIFLSSPPLLTALRYGLPYDLPECNARWDLRQPHKKSSVNNELNRLICVERMGALPHYAFNDFASQHIFRSTNSKGPTDGSKPPKR